jgi:hypothetical protein
LTQSSVPGLLAFNLMAGVRSAHARAGNLDGSFGDGGVTGTSWLRTASGKAEPGQTQAARTSSKILFHLPSTPVQRACQRPLEIQQIIGLKKKSL